MLATISRSLKGLHKMADIIRATELATNVFVGKAIFLKSTKKLTE